jgi:hypothetical protein
MNEFEREREEDIADQAADATEESRRSAGEEDRTVEDQAESGRVADDEADDDRPTAY